jgi:hypothetical protein
MSTLLTNTAYTNGSSAARNYYRPPSVKIHTPRILVARLFSVPLIPPENSFGSHFPLSYLRTLQIAPSHQRLDDESSRQASAAVRYDASNAIDNYLGGLGGLAAGSY